MIQFDRFVLKNGLRVVHHYDPSVSTVVLNTLYNVGARDENPERTGFAHLFEHLMFAGSKNVPSFDQEIEKAGGQNNAFTNNEFTNYYISVPVENIETAFWLESDRMFQLNINENSLKVQKGVVVEEFKQRCFNAPFGELWHHIREILYKESPYKWPTIGLTPQHVEEATLEDVKAFYDKHYHPKNAVLSIAGNLDLTTAKTLCEKWFETINREGSTNKNQYLVDSGFSPTTINKKDLSPNPAVFLVWKGPSLGEEGALALDVFADMLGGSDVSVLQETLVKGEGICNAAECFYLRGLGEGIFFLYGIANPGVSHETVKTRLLEVMHTYIENGVDPVFDFESVKNKTYTNAQFDLINPMNKAQKLAFWENAGNTNGINQELEDVRRLEFQSVINQAKQTLNVDSVSVLNYSPKTQNA